MAYKSTSLAFAALYIGVMMEATLVAQGCSSIVWFSSRGLSWLVGDGLTIVSDHGEVLRSLSLL